MIGMVLLDVEVYENLSAADLLCYRIELAAVLLVSLPDLFTSAKVHLLHELHLPRYLACRAGLLSM